jgi:hypothetical protein
VVRLQGQEDNKNLEKNDKKKRLAIFSSPAGISLTKLFLDGNNLIVPGHRVWLMTSQLATGKSLTFFTV